MRYKLKSFLRCVVAVTVAVFGLTNVAYAQSDPLPSWNNTASKKAIIEFVEKVTKIGSPHFVPQAERIATFDNDGCLWAEQPMYAQLVFAMDRVKALVPEHPEWATKQPFKSVLEGDMEALAASGDRGVLEVIMASHAGMTSVEFERIVKDWIASAKHPTTGQSYTRMVYQPMLELLDFLRVNGFKT